MDKAHFRWCPRGSSKHPLWIQSPPWPGMVTPGLGVLAHLIRCGRLWSQELPGAPDGGGAPRGDRRADYRASWYLSSNSCLKEELKLSQIAVLKLTPTGRASLMRPECVIRLRCDAVVDVALMQIIPLGEEIEVQERSTGWLEVCCMGISAARHEYAAITGPEIPLRGPTLLGLKLTTCQRKHLHPLWDD
ncbi:hypothetical protein NDU88_006479 [Pleurodeles waltl]|uniref:Uncharacterized protein n=1 Tax=Pleurodeles waltl TaxID=8319 RepID=A0AAV7WEZ5_PLEWA|nr:hypothetical protein NDU88_006479 [Pleurodeles waltl]